MERPAERCRPIACDRRILRIHEVGTTVRSNNIALLPTALYARPQDATSFANEQRERDMHRKGLMTATGSPTNELPDAAAVSVRRLVNNHVADLAGQLAVPETDRFEFLCECGKLDCDGHVSLTLAEYRELAPGSVLTH